MNYPLLDAFLTMLWFFLAVLWFFLLFRIVLDIFRDDELNGWAKAAWLVFVILLPFLGVFVYVVARGRSMGARDMASAQAQQDAFDTYVRKTAGTPAKPSAADELVKLTKLRDEGSITEEEYQRTKAIVLS